MQNPKVKNTLLNQEQRQAVSLALSSSICFLSGGPGSGKTFTAAEIVKTFLLNLPEDERKNASIKIAAPTGKAAAHLEKQLASQLENLAKIECKTLHSFLKSPMKKHAPTLFADLFLIDEASMLDGALFARLLCSFQGGGRLVLIGDKDQLPPVESGSFFADLMQVAKVANLPSLSLQECLRVEKMELLHFARSILKGEEETVFSSAFVSFFSPSQISEIRDWLQKQYIDPSLQILSCIRKGPLGVESINEMMLQKFLEGKDDNVLLSVPILITKNCEEMQLMNGDSGTLVAKASSFRKKRFTSDEKAHFAQRIFSAVTLPPFEWGYCLSVHKSQGSEYDRVIALVPPGSERFGREVLYTAVTRAKKEILLIGEKTVLSMLLQKSSRKASGLSSRLVASRVFEEKGVFVGSCIE
jgi:exodeoxyribonuclease V alpha subunit